MIIDKFSTETYQPEEENLLEYMVALADKIAPDYVLENGGAVYAVDSQAPNIFKRRYNSRRLRVAFQYEDFINRRRDDENIIDILDAVGIDVDKFWYLLLFISDYTEGSTNNASRISNTPTQDIESIVQFVEDNQESFNPLYGFKHKQAIRLTLSVKGKKIEINNPETISLITALCKESLGTFSENSLWNRHKVSEKHSTSNSIKIWLFASLFRQFFELYPQFSNQKKHKGGTSKSLLLLISKLVYFTGITQNPDYYLTDENLKAILRQYRNYKLDTINNYY